MMRLSTLNKATSCSPLVRSGCAVRLKVVCPSSSLKCCTTHQLGLPSTTPQWRHPRVAKSTTHTCSLVRPLLPAAPHAARSMAARAEKEAGHQVPNTSVVSEDAIDPEIKAFQEHQRTAARLSLADEVRTLVSLGRWGVLCTQGRQQLEGFPCGSVVEYALTEAGHPIFAFSTLSPHTGDLQTNPRASLVVTAPEFKGLADARVCLTGEITPVAAEALGPLKELYKQRHPGSFWVDFGDFKWFEMQQVVSARVIGGFARAGSVTGEEYFACTPDPVAAFSAPICGHMNDDHADATRAIVKHYTGLTVESASMLTVDRLGMNVQCTRDGQTFKARVPWVRPAEDRKSIKDVIVEMTRTAAAAASAAQSENVAA